MSVKTLDISSLSSKIKPFQSATQAIRSEHFTINTLGISSALLMENAGLAIKKLAYSCLKKLPKRSRSHIIIFSGPGNNGGDALVAARHLLADGIKLTICLCHESTSISQESKNQLNLLLKLIHQLKAPVTFIEYPEALASEPENKDDVKTVIIDGIFGAGLSRAPSGLYLRAITTINGLKARLGTSACVISIDVPSGCSLEASPPLGAYVIADRTITFGYLKRIHISEPTKKFAGICEAKSIGLFRADALDQFWIKHHAELLELLKPLDKSSHKGHFGHVAIVEGDNNYQGASRLVAKAALRVGSGLVTIITRDAQSLHPSDQAEYMKCAHENAAHLWPRLSTLVLGPGLGATPPMLAYGQRILENAQYTVKTLILDADGLRLLHEKMPLNYQNLICTPHPKEAARLLGVSPEAVENNRFLAIESLGRLMVNSGSCTIWVLKGATTLVYQKDAGIFAFAGDLPVLAVGGSGDLLAGAIAGLISQAISPLCATLLGINLQIRAALKVQKLASKGILPSELCDRFPSLLKRPAI